VLIAVTATAVGFAFDAGSGSKELSAVFAGCYVIGCLGAVLAARQAAVFTAVIQPPLVLFVSVPTAYFLFTSGQASGLRDLAINCGYPLIERFPLMFFTSAFVLLIGILRWYAGMSSRQATPRATEGGETREPKTGLASALSAKVSAKMSSLLAREPVDEDEEIAEPPRRRRSTERPRPTGGRTASGRSGRPSRNTASRSRHIRPPETDAQDPLAERPRRTRSSRQAEPPRDEPRRRPRTSNPRQPGPPPSERRTGYERPERRRRYDDYQEPREPHGRNGTNTHHPVSRVRYRGEETDDRAEYRTRRRTPRDWEAESWEYDI
jgi:hypothetical protein